MNETQEEKKTNFFTRYLDKKKAEKEAKELGKRLQKEMMPIRRLHQKGFMSPYRESTRSMTTDFMPYMTFPSTSSSMNSSSLSVLPAVENPQH